MSIMQNSGQALTLNKNGQTLDKNGQIFGKHAWQAVTHEQKVENMDHNQTDGMKLWTALTMDIGKTWTDNGWKASIDGQDWA